MNECGADQPRHERGILDRIPEPEATPTEFVVRPPAAKRDAAAQESPGHHGPGAHPMCPDLIAPAFQHGGTSEREADAEADVAHIENGWMHREGRILQHRIEVVAVR